MLEGAWPIADSPRQDGSMACTTSITGVDRCASARRGRRPGDDQGEPEGPFLRDAGDRRTSPGSVADDHRDLGDPRVGDGFEAVEPDGLVGDGHQLFGRSGRDRP
ncbi:hypothetical protein AQI96_09725 [Streptomyces canus]|nr:hypothetical protein AQI96_09725 [Streptomyces canus]